MTSIFEGRGPPKTNPNFQSKNWAQSLVPGIYIYTVGLNVNITLGNPEKILS